MNSYRDLAVLTLASKDIINIVYTSRSVADLQKRFPRNVVVPLDQVPLDKLKAYEGSK